MHSDGDRTGTMRSDGDRTGAMRSDGERTAGVVDGALAVAVGQDVLSVPTERLEAEATTLAGQVAALTCRWLSVVGELDRREAWRAWECTSMAHWLSWKCAISPVTGREHVRVARALQGLPLVRQRFAAGQLSFSKVRALTRLVRVPEMEAALVQFALDATAAQLDRVASAYRTVDRLTDPDPVRASFEQRSMTRRLGCDGSDTIVIRGPRDLVAEIWATLTASVVPSGTSGPTDGRETLDQRRFDAVVAACARLRQPDETLPPPVTVVVRAHADERGQGLDPAVPALLGGVPVSAPALRRLVGDAAYAFEQARSDGSTSRTRAVPTIPRGIRRAVRARDGHTCRWPSCTHRAHLHVHHIVWRSAGGTNQASNLILLCSKHHSAIHLGGWTIRGDAHAPVFEAPDGRRAANQVAAVPASVDDAMATLARHGAQVHERTIATAYGEPLDLHYAVSVLLDAEVAACRRN